MDHHGGPHSPGRGLCPPRRHSWDFMPFAVLIRPAGVGASPLLQSHLPLSERATSVGFRRATGRRDLCDPRPCAARDDRSWARPNRLLGCAPAGKPCRVACARARPSCLGLFLSQARGHRDRCARAGSKPRTGHQSPEAPPALPIRSWAFGQACIPRWRIAVAAADTSALAGPSAC